jgi:hypothetical protein
MSIYDLGPGTTTVHGKHCMVHIEKDDATTFGLLVEPLEGPTDYNSVRTRAVLSGCVRDLEKNEFPTRDAARRAAKRIASRFRGP